MSNMDDSSSDNLDLLNLQGEVRKYYEQLAWDSDGVGQNKLDNRDDIRRDHDIIKKIVELHLKPRDFPGEKKLDIKILDRPGTKQAYSSVLDKLYIQKDSELNISLTYDMSSNPTSRYSLLASVIFTDPVHVNVPVKVCPRHRDSSLGNRADHFLKIDCHQKDTRYFTVQNDINMIKIENLPNISETNRQETPLRLTFTDLSSCVGGVNRREICVVFCLEESDQQAEINNIVSTKVLNIKVCENAKRDMRVHEEKTVGQTKGKGSVSLSGKQETGQFWVLATSKSNYDGLVKVGAVLEEIAGGDMEVWRNEVERFNTKKIKLELDIPNA